MWLIVPTVLANSPVHATTFSLVLCLQRNTVTAQSTKLKSSSFPPLLLLHYHQAPAERLGQYCAATFPLLLIVCVKRVQRRQHTTQTSKSTQIHPPNGVDGVCAIRKPLCCHSVAFCAVFVGAYVGFEHSPQSVLRRRQVRVIHRTAQWHSKFGLCVVLRVPVEQPFQ